MAKAAFRHCDLPSRMRHFSVKQIERDHELAGRIKEVTAGVQRRRGHTSVGRPQMLHDIMSLVWAGMRDKAAGLVTYNTAIGALGTIQATQHAQRVFDEMDVQPDSITYSALIMAHHTNGDFGRVKQLTNDMLRLGFVPSRYVIGVQIKILALQGDSDGCRALLALEKKIWEARGRIHGGSAPAGAWAPDASHVLDAARSFARWEDKDALLAFFADEFPAVARERPAAVSSVVLQFYARIAAGGRAAADVRRQAVSEAKAYFNERSRAQPPGREARAENPTPPAATRDPWLHTPAAGPAIPAAQAVQPAAGEGSTPAQAKSPSPDRSFSEVPGRSVSGKVSTTKLSPTRAVQPAAGEESAPAQAKSPSPDRSFSEVPRRSVSGKGSTKILPPTRAVQLAAGEESAPAQGGSPDRSFSDVPGRSVSGKVATTKLTPTQAVQPASAEACPPAPAAPSTLDQSRPDGTQPESRRPPAAAAAAAVKAAEFALDNSCCSTMITLLKRQGDYQGAIAIWDALVPENRTGAAQGGEGRPHQEQREAGVDPHLEGDTHPGIYGCAHTLRSGGVGSIQPDAVTCGAALHVCVVACEQEGDRWFKKAELIFQQAVALDLALGSTSLWVMLMHLYAKTRASDRAERLLTVARAQNIRPPGDVFQAHYEAATGNKRVGRQKPPPPLPGSRLYPLKKGATDAPAASGQIEERMTRVLDALHATATKSPFRSVSTAQPVKSAGKERSLRLAW
ncbi:hypothetical protein DIPPA_29275 [Diplonema papillatum]|nr:hypothetical protein DIPPA_29275 [Diplonema papillatum]